MMNEDGETEARGLSVYLLAEIDVLIARKRLHSVGGNQSKKEAWSKGSFFRYFCSEIWVSTLLETVAAVPSILVGSHLQELASEKWILA